MRLNKTFLEKLKKIKTPFIIYDLNRIRKNYEEIAKVFHGIDIYYAMKCNSHLKIINLLKDLGSGFEVASVNESIQLLKQNVSPTKIICMHPIKSPEFLKFLRKHNNYSDRILAAGINAYLKSKYENIKPYPKVKSTLKKLKRRYKLAIVTDAPRLKAYVRLDEMGIADLFDIVVGREDTGREKPSKLPFKKALKVLKVKPSEAMHVGDWRERDILGAKKMGMKSCIAHYGDQHIGRKVWADCYIDRFEDLIKVLK